MPTRRLIPFLLLNILVSAVTVLAILYWWDVRNQERAVDIVSSSPPAIVPTTMAEVILDTGEEVEEPVDAAVPTEAPTATPSVERYTVASGDTLGSISSRFGISMDEIMQANGISNPNLINVGQELIIPENGFVPEEDPVAETSGEEAVPTPLDVNPPTPIPTLSLGEGAVQLAITDVVGAGLLDQERVQIINEGERAIEMENWELQGDLSSYRFGQLTLYGEGAGIWVNTRGEDETAGITDIFWGEAEARWQSGEELRLIDADGTEQAVFTVP